MLMVKLYKKQRKKKEVLNELIYFIIQIQQIKAKKGNWV